MAGRRALVLALCACIALALGCGEEDPREPHREGLTVSVAGIGYTVFLSRQLNPQIPPDRGYYERDAAPAGTTHFGVFLKACNEQGSPRNSARGFLILDNEGNGYRPIDLPPTNPFAYNSELLEREECIPAAGSVAALGPTAGALLLFELPLDAMENRPLILHIGSRMPNAEAGRIELDL